MIGASVRSVAVAATVFLLFTVGLLGTGVGGAQNGAFPIEEDFDDETLADWTLYNQASSGETVDGESSLRLTTAGQYQMGTALYNEKFPTDTGITAEFRYYADDGTGADGVSFFFLNASQVDPGTFSPGPSGGGFGYKAITDFEKDNFGSGVRGGFLGVAFDEYGAFGDGPGVAVRGAGNASLFLAYPLLDQTNESDIQGGDIDGGWRRVRISTYPKTGTTDKIEIQIEMSFDGGTTWETVINGTYSEDEISSAFPEEFYLGLTGVTGASTNVHAIDDLSVRKPADVATTVTTQPPTVAPGDTVEYAFKVSNDGPNGVDDLTLSSTVATGAGGLNGIDWDVGDDGTFEEKDSTSTAIQLSAGETKTIRLRGKVDADAEGNLNHNISTSLGQELIDPTPSNGRASISLNINGPPTTPSLNDNSITQSATTNAVVGTLTAEDPDGDTLSYSLINGNGDDDNGKFSIDGTELRADDASTMPAGDYSVRVEAADGKGGTTENALTVTVVDNLPPQLTVTVTDNTDGDGTLAAGDEVQIEADVTDVTDVDTVIADASAFDAGHQVDLSHDTGTTYKESVTVGQNPTQGTQSVTVTATDTKDNEASVTGGQLTVDTNPPDITGVTISDDDGNDVLADGDDLTIEAEVTDATTVDTVTADVSAFDEGEISLSSTQGDTYRKTITLDGSLEEGAQSVTVSATDDLGNGGGQDSASNALTVDNTPPTTTDDTGDADEDVTGTQLVSDVRTNDDDGVSADSDLEVTEVDGDTNNVGQAVAGTAGGQFTITADGEVTFDAERDFESLNNGDTEQTSVAVTVADEAGNEDTSTVTATVQGVNDDPTGLSIDDTNLLQSAGTDAPVGTLSATDVDNDDAALTYTLVTGAGDGDNGEFSIDGDELEATDASTMADGEYDVRVRAEDPDGGTTDAQFDITVDDNVEPTIHDVTITDATDGNGILADGDDLTIEAEVTDVTAVDTVTADAAAYDAGTVTLTHAGDDTYDETLQIGQKPTEGAQSVTVSATDDLDNGGSQDSASNDLTVDLTPPATADDAGTGNEDENGTTLVDDIRTNDTDAVSDSADLTVTKVDGATNNVGGAVAGTDGGQFTVTAAGKVTFDADADFESLNDGDTEQTSVAVTVADEAGNENTSTVTSTVEGVNDDPTNLSVDNTTVRQSAGVNATVGTLSAEDVDNDVANLTYTLVAGTGDANNSEFKIDGDELQARNASVLPNGTYQVRAQAADPNGGTTEEPFTITVVDDVAPRISAASITDATDDNGILAAGDTLRIEANVTDITAVDTVTANASAFDDGTATLERTGGDTYTQTVTVGADATEFDQTVTVNATDTVDNGGAQAAVSNPLVVDLTPPTIANDSATVTEYARGRQIVADLRLNDTDAVSDSTDLVVTAVAGDPAGVGRAVEGSDGGRFTVTSDGQVTFNALRDFIYLFGGESAQTSIEVTVADEAGNEANQTINTTVEGVYESSSGPNVFLPAPTQRAAATQTYTVENLNGGQQVVIDGASVSLRRAEANPQPGLRDPLARTENVRLDQVAVAVESDTDLTVDIGTYDEDLTPSAGGETPPTVESAAASFQAETGRVAAGYVSVNDRIGAESISGATLDFSVRAGYLEGLGVAPGEVTLYHLQDDGSWVERETAYRGRTGEYHRYTGSTPSFSMFALGTPAPSVVVTDARVNRSADTATGTTTVRVRIENRGVTDARPSIEITADGDPLQTLRPTIRANASTTVVETITLPAGASELVVAGQSLGTIGRDAAGQPVDRTGPSPFVPTPGVAVVLAVLTLLAIGRRRH